MITVIFMYAILAATFTVAKKVLNLANDPYFVIAFRMILAGTIFLSLQYVFNRRNFFMRREDAFLFFKTAFFYIYLAFIPEFWALKRLTSSKVVIIYSITPFLAAIFAYFLASERLTRKKILGMLIGTLGIMPLLMTPDSPGVSAAELFSISIAEAVLLVAVIAAAYGWFPVKELMNKGYTLPMINGVTMLIGGISALLTSIIVNANEFMTTGVFVPPIKSFGPFFLWLLVLIILANGIFYNMYGWHLRHYSFTLLSFAGFLCPLFGAYYGWQFLGEAITWNHFVSLILIGFGLLLFYQDELRNRKRA